MALEWSGVEWFGLELPGKSAVAAELASAVHDNFGRDWNSGKDQSVRRVGNARHRVSELWSNKVFKGG
jgi:hypothetical protein